MVALRRRLHRQPELAFGEHRTALCVRKELISIDGVRVLETPAGGTGVLALIEGGLPGKTILFRADMDALPIAEAGTAASAQQPGASEAALSRCCVLCRAPWDPVPAPDDDEEPAGAGNLARNVPKAVVSEVAGASHACGHDGHMAMLLGAARLLAPRRAALRGRLVLLFQPAEERHPLNNPMGGAIRMIRDLEAGEALCEALGVEADGNGAAAVTATDGGGARVGVKRDARGAETAKSANGGGNGARPPPTEKERNETDGHDTSMDGRLLAAVDEVYGAHLWNYASAGTVGCAGGSVTANSDSLTIVVRGTGGHASAPQGTVDAVVVASQLVVALQTIVSRNVSPTESAVITLGKLEGGFAPNVIATSVRILGTVRTFTAPVKRLVRRRIAEVAAGVAASHGSRCSIDVTYADGYPACVNDPGCAAAVVEAGERLLGGPRLCGAPTPNMAGEDFAFLLARVKGAFFFVGSNPHARLAMDPGAPVEEAEREHGERRVVAHHTPEFDIHEGSIAVGCAMWVALAEHRLK